MSRTPRERSGGAARGYIQPVIKTRELRIRDTRLTCDFEKRRQMNAVVAPQRVPLRELAGVFAQGVSDFNNHIPRPLDVECPLRSGKAGSTEYVFTTPPSEGCPYLRVGHRRRSDARCEFHLFPDTLVA